MAATSVTGVYGFAGWLASFILYGFYLLWAFIPEEQLHALGITYYPSKYWALALPCYVLVALTSIVVGYCSLNMMDTSPLDSLDTLTDNFTRPSTVLHASRGEDGTIRTPAIGDLDIALVNSVLYGRQHSQFAAPAPT
ncbi:PIG-P [Tribonema minus]|uniref:PIG-P n=1 Tax=Tribonema minus TaxID=303371 RepID=A0A835YPJ9_9STRA|nr:PIG-P [Tribonema minus]